MSSRLELFIVFFFFVRRRGLLGIILQMRYFEMHFRRHLLLLEVIEHFLFSISVCLSTGCLKRQLSSCRFVKILKLNEQTTTKTIKIPSCFRPKKNISSRSS